METFPRHFKKKYIFPNDSTFKAFKEKYKEYGDVSNPRLKKIVRVFCDEFTKALKDNRDGITLPDEVATIFIGSCLPKNKTCVSRDKYVNGKPEVYNNIETENRLMKIFMATRTSIPIRHRKIWTFSINQTRRRELSRYYKKNYLKYVVVDNYLHINSLFANKRK